MKRILILVAISLFSCSTARAFQGGGGESTKKGAIKGQLLRRQIPVKEYYYLDDLRVTLARGISKATAAAFSGYLRSHLTEFELINFELFSVPGSTKQFFVTVSVNGGETSILLLLRKHGADITETGRFEKAGGTECLPYFFIGRDRVLLFVWNMAGDGDFHGNWAFEIHNETLKALGELDVIDQVPNELIYNRSPIETATAEYKRGTYYLTMRGRGSLYSIGKYDRRLARRGMPLTYVYDEGTWIPAATRK